MELSIMERLCFSTVRIETKNVNGDSFSGTGFFFNLIIDENTVPLIVTNKHVIQGMTEGHFTFTERDADGTPMYRKHFPFIINKDFESVWVMHPDPQVDICVMPIFTIIDLAHKYLKKIFFYTPFANSLIPSKEQLEEVDVAEEVLMIGYPNGLWDSINNMPIVRKGIMATNILLDHNGKREFVIDAACFPGSSGSPVILVNKGTYTDKRGNLKLGGRRLMLLGILYAGPQMTVTGELKVVTIPNIQQKVMSVSHIPNNLGYVIKSDTLLDFIPLLRDRINKEKASIPQPL